MDLADRVAGGAFAEAVGSLVNERGGNLRVLELLRDGRWHTAAEIERVCEVTCHSRISDLRNRHGHLVERRRNPGGTGRGKFMYRLVSERAGGGLAGLDVSERLGPDDVSSPASASLQVPCSLPRAGLLPAQTPPAAAGGSAPPEAAHRRYSIGEVVELLGRHGLVEVGAEQGERLFDAEAETAAAA